MSEKKKKAEWVDLSCSGIFGCFAIVIFFIMGFSSQDWMNALIFTAIIGVIGYAQEMRLVYESAFEQIRDILDRQYMSPDSKHDDIYEVIEQMENGNEHYHDREENFPIIDIYYALNNDVTPVDEFNDLEEEVKALKEENYKLRGRLVGLEAMQRTLVEKIKSWEQWEE